MRSTSIRIAACVGLCWAGVGAAVLRAQNPAATVPATMPATAPAADVARFLSFDDTPGAERLRTSIVTFRNAAGQTVDLVGAVHIADKPYYDELNRRFAKYDSVLYEMVKPKDAQVPARNAPRRGGGGWISGLQRGMQRTLALSFQLDEVDYTPKNFVHADMDWETFEKMQSDRGESFLSMALKSAMNDMNKGSARKQMTLGELMLALNAPDRARQLKLLVGRQFADAEALTRQMEGPNGSVILTERNKAALAVLDRRLQAGDKKLAVFYGAAHLSGMEKMLLDRGFTPVGEPVWLTAWDIARVQTPPHPPATTMPTTQMTPTTPTTRPDVAAPATRPAD